MGKREGRSAFYDCRRGMCSVTASLVPVSQQIAMPVGEVRLGPLPDGDVDGPPPDSEWNNAVPDDPSVIKHMLTFARGKAGDAGKDLPELDSLPLLCTDCESERLLSPPVVCGLVGAEDATGLGVYVQLLESRKLYLCEWVGWFDVRYGDSSAQPPGLGRRINLDKQLDACNTLVETIKGVRGWLAKGNGCAGCKRRFRLQ